MMKVKFLVVFLFFVLIIWLSGCTSRLGQTSDETARTYSRTIRVNTLQLLEDIDRAMLLDKPSKLSDKRIP